MIAAVADVFAWADDGGGGRRERRIHDPINGTYTIDTDCTGTFVINFVSLHLRRPGCPW